MGAAVALQRRQSLVQGLSPQPGAGRPVDLVHLARFTLGDEKLEREILQLFRVQTRIYLDRLERARDAVHWRQAAHTIKGSAKGIGAWAVAAAAQRAEELPNPPGGKGTGDAAKELKATVETAIGFIDVLLAEH
ncbi:MAG: Hpt domain-containing protein [Hyphomicrobiales bacterium]|nr:Hpt domain-containing protein [Hyphomicrobiales bacterium]